VWATAVVIPGSNRRAEGTWSRTLFLLAKTRWCRGAGGRELHGSMATAALGFGGGEGDEAEGGESEARVRRGGAASFLSPLGAAGSTTRAASATGGCGVDTATEEGDDPVVGWA
jgi:hypothetical protein